MTRLKSSGIPAASFFAGRSFTSVDRQAIPIVAAGVLQPPIPREQDAISQAFTNARATIAKLEADRDAHSCWSPAQAAVYRRSA